MAKSKSGNNRKRKYLITGAAGFIASNFVRVLYQNEPEAEVTVLDKLTYSANLNNLKEFNNCKGFRFVEGDICDEKLVNALVPDVNVVINFAAETAVDRSIVDPQSFLKTDVIGVYTLLTAARQSKVLTKFIQISTDEVYGQILKGSFKETSQLCPRNPYSASKLGGDRLAYSFFVTYGLPVVITRASNNYGPYAYLEKVVPLFITNLLDNQPVPVYGKGKQVRDWLFVEDHCNAVYLLVDKGVNGEVYNIGGAQECSNLELTEKILKLMGKDKSFIKYVADRPGHDFRYSLDCSKLKKLGWKPKYTIQAGLIKTIDWYRSNENWWRPVKDNMEKRYLTGYWGEKK